MSNTIHRIKTPPFSGATDYAYLVNNNLGWLSDDQEYFEFDNEDERDKFQLYLDQCKGAKKVILIAPDYKTVKIEK